MCGICGKYNFDYLESVSKNTIMAMTDLMIARGPDDGDTYVNKNIGLGFRRLSIIDLEGGRQPLSNETEDIWLVANGEIYNYVELTDKLKHKGHRFKTGSDSEVIIHAYEEYDVDCFRYFRGMFSIGIYDLRKNRLVLARDGVGIKPLYYRADNKSLTFASELKAFFKDPETNYDLNYEGLAYYFTFNYIPEPFSVFKDIKKLIPGNYLISDKGKITIRKFWDVKIRENNDMASDEILRAKIEDSVKSHLVSDVPVGVFLSGGIDSSAVCAYYRKNYSGEIHTFSVGFPEDSYSELPYARRMAKALSTNHHEVLVEGNIAEILPEIVTYFDEPYADSSMVPLYFVSKLAQEYVKVVLVGDSADELFGGYETYLAAKYLRTYKSLPNLVRVIIEKAVNSLPVSYKKVSLEQKLKRFIKFSRQDNMISSHALWRCIFDRESLSSLLHPNILSTIDSFGGDSQLKRTAENIRFKGSINDYCYLDLKHYLPADMLVKVDRMAMMNSLEARVPFLDQPLVEYAFSVPSKFKVRNWKTKYLMKRALRGLLPEEIVNRKKAGFNVPLSSWITGPLRTLFQDYLESCNDAHTIISKKSVETLFQDHMRGRVDNSFQLWNVLVFYIWYDRLYKKLGMTS